VDSDENQIDRIEDILNRHSPVNVHTDDAYSTGTSSTAGTKAAGVAGFSTAAMTNAGTNASVAGANAAITGANAEEAIPVVEEELQVGKRRVLRGGVRVYSRLVEQPVEESVNLQEERVRVERRPVNRPVTDADFQTGQEQVIEVDEYAE
jgi:stress response protein YsnF